MNKLLTGLLDIIFPPRESQKLIDKLDSRRIHLNYNLGKVADTYFLSSYKDGEVRALVTENKFHNNHKAAALLSDLLKNWLQNTSDKTLLVAIPLGPKRQRERGYNQVQNIIDNIDTHENEKLLVRKINTEPQTALDKNNRAQNLKGAFFFNKSKLDLRQYDQVVIVDDVITTGATMKEARASLAPHLSPNVKLICLAIAH